MRKNLVTVVATLVATLGGLVNPAHAADRHIANMPKHESHTAGSTKADPYDLRYGTTHGSMVKRLIGDFDSAKMQLDAVVAAACSALRNSPSGEHPYQQVLQLAYADIAKQLSAPHPPTFTQAMKECADIFDRTAVR